MSELSNLIFHGAEHKISSPYGNRAVIQTSAGKTSSFHNGCDYSTGGKKLPQYGVADDGVVLSCGADSPAYGGALFVWVSYPSLGVKLLHYHLDSISVKKGQKVTKKTVIGYTGKSGKATGIHLHLGIKRLSGGDYIDPEKWAKDEFPKLIEKKTTVTNKTSTATGSFFPPRGYFKKGDVSANVGKVAAFMRKTFPSYTSEKALGNTYGDNIIKAITEFQKRTGLKADGNLGPLTLAELTKYGFKW